MWYVFDLWSAAAAAAAAVPAPVHIMMLGAVPAAGPCLQTITHMIDDVLSDSLLHKDLAAGDVAFMELSRRTGLPVCSPCQPGQPLEVREPELEEGFTVVRAGQELGKDDMLLARAADGGGRGSGSGAGDGKSWVLATGGLEDGGADVNNN
jgi:hypothetical protein